MKPLPSVADVPVPPDLLERLTMDKYQIKSLHKAVRTRPAWMFHKPKKKVKTA